MSSRSRSSIAPSVAGVACAVVWLSGCVAGEIGDGLDAPEVSSDFLAAMERDLGETAEEVERRLQAEAIAARLEPRLRAEIGGSFAGAWMSDDGTQLIVAVTDAGLVEDVRAAGAEPRVVDRSLAELADVKAVLDVASIGVDPGVHAWYVDVRRNRVVVLAEDPASPAVAAFVSAAGDAGAVEVIEELERPRPLYDVRGGDELILGGNTLCSVGFAVHGGFVTAGHCGQVGTTTAGSNWVAQGTVRGSTFPTHDYAWVEVNASWNTLPEVGNHAGGAVAVHGSQPATINSSVCRSGRTTGWRCGVIEGFDVTVNYAAGPVYGMTRTSACAEGGDSGGSFISGNQAQGVTSGGSGSCTTGGTTFFQPINPILAAYGLTLKTSGGGTPGAIEIVGRHSGKCVDVSGAGSADGTNIQLWECNGTGAQGFLLQHLGGGYYNLVNTNSGKCVDVRFSGTGDGVNIQLWSCNGTNAQKFYFQDFGGGNYRVVNVNSNRCVDAEGWGTSSGTNIQQWGCHGGENQQWQLYYQ